MVPPKSLTILGLGHLIHRIITEVIPHAVADEDFKWLNGSKEPGLWRWW